MAKNMPMGFQLGKIFGTAALAVLGCTSCAIKVGVNEPGFNQRGLTPEEVEMANSFFGSGLNTSDIQISAIIGTKSKALNGQIYMSENNYSDNFAAEDSIYKKSIFIHELTHIWQEQNGIDIVGSAISNFFDFGGDYDKSYAYNLEKDKIFKDLNIEQQAKMVADYYKERDQLAPYSVDIFCADLLKKEDILRQAFPHLKTPSLCKNSLDFV
jgi:hypothetical protein